MFSNVLEGFLLFFFSNVFARLMVAMTLVLAAVVESQLAAADSLMTWIRDGAVQLRMKDAGHGSEPPVTVMAAFDETVQRCPDRIAICEQLQPYTYRERNTHTHTHTFNGPLSRSRERKCAENYINDTIKFFP